MTARVTRRVVLRNDFHDTRAVLYVGNDGQLSKDQVYRARRKLCGMSDCSCGGYLGERGDQPGGVEVECRPELHDEGDALFILWPSSTDGCQEAVCWCHDDTATKPHGKECTSCGCIW